MTTEEKDRLRNEEIDNYFRMMKLIVIDRLEKLSVAARVLGFHNATDAEIEASLKVVFETKSKKNTK